MSTKTVSSEGLQVELNKLDIKKMSPEDILHVAKLAEEHGDVEIGKYLRITAYENAKSMAWTLASAWNVCGDGRAIPFLEIAELEGKAAAAAHKGDIQAAEKFHEEAKKKDDAARKGK